MKRNSVFAWIVVVVCLLVLGCGKKKGEKPAASSGGPPASAGADKVAADQGVRRLREVKKPDDTARPAARPDQARPGEARADDSDKKPEARPEAAPPVKGQAQAQMLVIGWKGGGIEGVKRTPEQAKALAAKVSAMAAKGNFTKLVKKYSDGPNKDSGGKTAAMTAKDAVALFKPVFKLQVGQVSKVVKGDDGYYIFKRIK